MRHTKAWLVARLDQAVRDFTSRFLNLIRGLLRKFAQFSTKIECGQRSFKVRDRAKSINTAVEAS